MKPEHDPLTARDFMAMAALTGLCAALEYKGPSYFIHEGGIVADAYGLADAMMIERKKGVENGNREADSRRTSGD